jgi:hypothetical protein
LSSGKIIEKRWQMQQRTGFRVPELVVGRRWKSPEIAVES